VQKIRIDRADGRYALLYAFERDAPAIINVATNARGQEQIELRWNALLGDWVIVSTGRQERTFLPPDEHCPLCATSPGGFTTEIPASEFEIAVFENRWPSFRADAPAIDERGWAERRARAAGVCEVVVYSSDHAGTLGTMTKRQVRQLVDVWAERYEELGARPEVEYVFIFENRGREIGVTLTHPHGQIYAFPFVPPRAAQEHEASARYGSIEACLMCDTATWERKLRTRVIAESEGFVAYVPFAARVPYEVHVVATEHRESLLELTYGERDGLAVILREVQGRYDGLWGFPMPYTMSMHQRATDDVERQGEHLHVEFLPPYRSRDKLKYLAGVETGAGTFINDTSPEEKAAEMRNVRWEAGSEK
jgi:UDPglucose--hexose-1-phosphate uridylyltransferase